MGRYETAGADNDAENLLARPFMAIYWAHPWPIVKMMHLYGSVA